VEAIAPDVGRQSRAASLDHTHWVKSRSRFFLSIQVLRRIFRGKLVAGVKQAFQNRQLHFPGNLAVLAAPKTFAAWLRPLFRKDWVVYAKRPFGGPEYVVQYLGRYTHRVAISNHRLISFAKGKVTFRWRDSAHNNEHKLMTLALDEFLRRFLLHLLPKGFVRIRNFAFWPTADAPLSCRFAFHCSACHKNRNPSKIPYPPMTRTVSSAVPSAVDQ